MAISDLVQDPENALPDDTKAGLVSIALSVHRELDQDFPDLDFLVGINENMIGGLSGST
jgi:flagellar biosynthesis activator protein FlaF